MFGGMEICGLCVVVGKDGREQIIKAFDSTFALMGDAQEDDRRHIADLVSTRMQVIFSKLIEIFNKSQTFVECLSSRSRPVS